MCENGLRARCERTTGGKGAHAYLRYSGNRENPRIRWTVRGLPDGAGFDGTRHGAGLCMWWGRQPFFEGRVPAGIGWTTVGGRTVFRDATGANSGIRSIVAGRSVRVEARGPRIVDNPYGWIDPLFEPADRTASLLVQLHAENGRCVAATFSHYGLQTSWRTHSRWGRGS